MKSYCKIWLNFWYSHFYLNKPYVRLHRILEIVNCNEAVVSCVRNPNCWLSNRIYRYGIHPMRKYSSAKPTENTRKREMRCNSIKNSYLVHNISNKNHSTLVIHYTHCIEFAQNILPNNCLYICIIFSTASEQEYCVVYFVKCALAA